MKLEVGPEKNKHTGRERFDDSWTTMGLSDKNLSIDLVADMNRRWPPDTCSCDIVYAAHVLEHARNPIHWVREAYRVLKPGGVLRVSVPNAVWLAARYVNGQSTLFDFARNFRSWHGAPGTKAHWHPFDTQACRRLLCWGQYEMLGIDEPEITTDSEVLFTDVAVVGPGMSRSPEMQHDYFSTRFRRSIFCEGTKP